MVKLGYDISDNFSMTDGRRGTDNNRSNWLGCL